MSSVAIRIAKASDAAAILDVYRPYVETTPITFETEVPDLEEFTSRVASLSGPYPYLLLYVDGRLAGYAYAHRQAERAAFGWNAELSVYLRMDMRAKGLGKPLYALLIDLLAMQGYVNLYGVITASNAGSIAMHEHMGFVRCGVHERTGFKLGRWHDTVWMHRRIGGDGAPGRLCRFDALRSDLVSAKIAAAQEKIADRLTARRE